MSIFNDSTYYFKPCTLFNDNCSLKVVVEGHFGGPFFVGRSEPLTDTSTSKSCSMRRSSSFHSGMLTLLPETAMSFLVRCNCLRHKTITHYELDVRRP